MERKGRLPSSLTCGRISLIPKKGNGTKINHWRPLTILNESYRILAGVLSRQIEPILNKKVGPEQKGFLKGRNIADISRNIQACIESVRERKTFGALIAVDLKKAFDTISHTFILKAIKKYLPRRFFNPIRSLLFNGTSVVSINGIHSESIRLGRSCRQGCPVSPLLFVTGMD
ncbi:Exonuclease-endonuclease-phosphatase domain superfamily, partial [Caligus rogercresseyi]